MSRALRLAEVRKHEADTSMPRPPTRERVQIRAVFCSKLHESAIRVTTLVNACPADDKYRMAQRISTVELGELTSSGLSLVNDASRPSLDERASFATISLDLVQDWLASLRSQCSAPQYEVLLEEVGLSRDAAMLANRRVTRDEFVKLYQGVVVSTGDEMTGLWSRPIRSGTLKFLCTTMMEASSIYTALYRFTRFWNLLLDDFQLQMTEEDGAILVRLSPRGKQRVPHRFGHMLLLKLAHGILSWLAGYELPLKHVGFAFARPPFAEDYPILFPAPVSFGEPCSSISLARRLGALPIKLRKADLRDFLVRSPRDWIFTAYTEHTLHLKIRELVSLSCNMSGTLEQAGHALNMSPRTLIRKLAADGTSFQEIKDGVRRDRAIGELIHTTKSLTRISYEIGFSSPAVFHRAFRRWTGVSPSIYRQHFQQY